MVVFKKKKIIKKLKLSPVMTSKELSIKGKSLADVISAAIDLKQEGGGWYTPEVKNCQAGWLLRSANLHFPNPGR